MIAELELKRGVLKEALIEIPYNEVFLDGKSLRYTESSRHTVSRTRTLLTKEPTTVPWMNTFEAGEVMFDVGANVGMYSIYAAVIKGARVYSFEPEALNFAELNKNIHLNDVHDRVTAYCAAISDEKKVSILHLGGFATGWSHHDFDENTWKGDKNFGGHVSSRDTRPRQGSLSISLDELVSSGAIEPPNHIKIDVDGIEARVVRGAKHTLRAPGLKTVLLEVDYHIDENVKLIDYFEAEGWRYSMDQVRVNQHEKLTANKAQERRQRRKGGQNYIFFKDDFYMNFFGKFAEDFVPPNPIKK